MLTRRQLDLIADVLEEKATECREEEQTAEADELQEICNILDQHFGELIQMLRRGET